MAGAAAGPPRRSFRDCLRDLADRRQRELGTAWARLAQRSQRAEASRRARTEMIRRIETRAGRQYASSTIARWAAQGQWPPGVEPFWLERWAMIDRAGGINALAAALRSTPSRVVKWRDSRDPNEPLPPPVEAPEPGEVQTIRVRVEGFATIGTTRVDKTIPSAAGEDFQELEIDLGTGILDAWFVGDTDTVAAVLGEVIAEQVLVDWNPAQFYDMTYTVTDIIEFDPNPD